MTTDLAGARGTAAGDAHLRLRPTRGYEEKGGARSAHLEVLGDAFEPTEKETEGVTGAEGDRAAAIVLDARSSRTCWLQATAENETHTRSGPRMRNVQSRTTATRRSIQSSPVEQGAPIVPMAAAAEETRRRKLLGFPRRGGSPAYKGERRGGWREGSTPSSLRPGLTSGKKEGER